MNAEQAIAVCATITREHSSTFHLGSRFFLGDQRKAVQVIYAVCRSGDDAVDESASAALSRARLDAWWQHVERAYGGAPRADEALEVALAWALERYPLPKHAFDELLLGLESDLEPSEFATVDELLVYCRRVAGVVGLLIAPVAGYRGGEETLACALALGQAMQLTNILRDVGEDLARGRCYLPGDLIRRYGVDVDRLRRGHVDANYVALLEELIALSHRLYRRGWQGIPNLDGAAATAVGVAALNYQGILRKLVQNGYDNLNRRAHLRPLERIVLIPRAVARGFGAFG